MKKGDILIYGAGDPENAPFRSVSTVGRSPGADDGRPEREKYYGKNCELAYILRLC